MSHDLYLYSIKNHCDSCGREDIEHLAEENVSYNHCWIWYDSFDKERGFRAMYDVPIDILIPRLEILKATLVCRNGGIPTHKMITEKDHVDRYGQDDYGKEEWSDSMIRTIDCGQYEYDKYMKDDGWAKTNYNAYRCINDILRASYANVIDYPQACWRGD